MRKTNLLIIISFTILIAFNACCDKDNDPYNSDYGEYKDSRDGKVYKWVKIGKQIWFAENLNIGTMINGNDSMSNDSITQKYCYENKTYNCDKLGGLYQWKEMMNYDTSENSTGICPNGWHIPSDFEWITLESFVDSIPDSININWTDTGYRGIIAGKNLKSKEFWSNENGTDKYHFCALGSGVRVKEPDYFGDLEELGYYWTSSLYKNSNDNLGWIRILDHSSNQIRRKKGAFSSGRAVRCIKD